MKPGDPYLTEELDDLRSEQRLLYAVIRASHVGQTYTEAPVSLEGDRYDPPALAEFNARLIINDLLEPHRGFLDREERNQAAQGVRRMSYDIHGDHWIEAAKDNIANRMLDVAQEHPPLGDAEDKDLRRTLRDALVLMDVADILAGRTAE